MLACELIDFRLVELSCADLVLKEDIQLAISTPFSLWKTEIRPGAKEKAGTGPEKSLRPLSAENVNLYCFAELTGFSPPIPSVQADHSGH
jgi:hypothetical protein